MIREAKDMGGTMRMGVGVRRMRNEVGMLEKIRSRGRKRRRRTKTKTKRRLKTVSEKNYKSEEQ